MVRALVCGTGGREFKSHYPPQDKFPDDSGVLFWFNVVLLLTIVTVVILFMRKYEAHSCFFCARSLSLSLPLRLMEGKLAARLDRLSA